MDKTSELQAMLGKFLTWNKARLDCFTRMLLALFIVRTVNLSELAVAMASKAEFGSRYKRLQRFFRHFRMDYHVIAKLIFTLFFSDKKIYITIDRTNWFWGKAKINILTLAVAYEGVAIPILWCLLNKAGNATAKEHRAILVRFIKLFGQECIVGVLADREFASGTLFGFCWAHKTGEWCATKKPIRLCKHRDSMRPQNSYMRYGLDYIREIIVNPFKKIKEFRKALAIFESDAVTQGGTS